MSNQAAMVVILDDNNKALYPLSLTQNIFHNSQAIYNTIEEIVQMEYMDQETFDSINALPNHTYNIYEKQEVLIFIVYSETDTPYQVRVYNQQSNITTNVTISDFDLQDNGLYANFFSVPKPQTNLSELFYIVNTSNQEEEEVNIKIGDFNIADTKIGEAQISSIYAGGVLIWEAPFYGVRGVTTSSSDFSI